MTATSADGPASDGELWVELSQRYHSSALGYSEDTFESFSEEEGSCWQRGSEPSEEYGSTEDLEGSAVLGTWKSTSHLAGRNRADEQSEEVDSAAVERDVLGKWVDLQNKEVDIKQDKSVLKTQAGLTELVDGELAALGSFCTAKISAMRQQLISRQANGSKSRKLQHSLTAKNPETRGLNCLVPDQLMNRIRLANVRETVKQVTEVQIHECSACPDCQKKEAELARITFLRQKKVLVETALIQEKLEGQIYSTNVLTLLGEALGSFPKPSEDPRNLWQRLKERSEYVKPESSKDNSRT